jgi:hypothetical protein
MRHTGLQADPNRDRAHYPWSEVKEHRFENLIALCPTCHTRYDQGTIDRRSMLVYKALLRQSEDSATAALRTTRVAAYLSYSRALNAWDRSINAIALQDVAMDHAFNSPERTQLVQGCGAAAAEARAQLTQFKITFEQRTQRAAQTLYDAMLSFAHDVVDGLWPSTHVGADQHDDVGPALDELLTRAADELGLDEDELSPTAPKLGGTGKRF